MNNLNDLNIKKDNFDEYQDILYKTSCVDLVNYYNANKVKADNLVMEDEFVGITYDNLNVINQKIDKISGNEKVEEVILQDGTKKALEGIFIAIGTASTEDLAKKIGIILKNKYILVDQKMHTNIEGVFACGDCTGGLLQISKAIYEATIAALEVIEYIKRRE